MQHLESRLGLPHASFFGHVRGTYGNLIASKVPLQNVMHIHLRGGSEVRLKDGGPHRIARGLLCADLSVCGVHLRVLLTHLDHMSTEERRTQMRHLLQSLRTLANKQQCLLIGDLNALSRCDLTSQEWVSHEQYNLSMGWEQPIDESQAGGVLAMLRDAQFVDSYASLECPPDWRAPPWTAHVRDQSRPRYRIDYVWSRAPSTAVSRCLMPRAASVESNCQKASDHQPLVIDFEATQV